MGILRGQSTACSHPQIGNGSGGSILTRAERPSPRRDIAHEDHQDRDHGPQPADGHRGGHAHAGRPGADQHRHAARARRHRRRRHRLGRGLRPSHLPGDPRGHRHPARPPVRRPRSEPDPGAQRRPPARSTASAATARRSTRSPASTSRCGTSRARSRGCRSTACSAAARVRDLRPTRASCGSDSRASRHYIGTPSLTAIGTSSSTRSASEVTPAREGWAPACR